MMLFRFMTPSRETLWRIVFQHQRWAESITRPGDCRGSMGYFPEVLVLPMGGPDAAGIP